LPKDVVAGIKAGFRDYIIRPFNKPKFVQTINELLDSVKNSV